MVPQQWAKTHAGSGSSKTENKLSLENAKMRIYSDTAAFAAVTTRITVRAEIVFFRLSI